MLKNKIILYVFITILMLTSIFSKSITAHAAYSQETKRSIYTYESAMSKIYPAFKIKKDNHGYYATYKNNGSFEVYLGKSKNMYFSDFSKKLGGNTTRKVKTFKITKTSYYLKKHGTGLAISLLCEKAGIAWYTSYFLGVAGDTGVGKLLLEPGTYRSTVITSSVKIRDGSTKNKPYTSTYYYCPYIHLEKKDGNKWVTINKSTTPIFMY